MACFFTLRCLQRRVSAKTFQETRHPVNGYINSIRVLAQAKMDLGNSLNKPDKLNELNKANIMANRTKGKVSRRRSKTA